MWRFLRLEDFWGMAVQSTVLRALWKNPDSSSEDCRSDPVIGKGLISTWGGGPWEDAISVLLHGGGTKI